MKKKIDNFFCSDEVFLFVGKGFLVESSIAKIANLVVFVHFWASFGAFNNFVSWCFLRFLVNRSLFWRNNEKLSGK